MFFAAKEGYLEVTKLLIKAGAKVALKDKVNISSQVHSINSYRVCCNVHLYPLQNNVTALDLARVHGMKEVCTLLETYMPSKEKLAPQVNILTEKVPYSVQLLDIVFLFSH